jgi:hypothetical protein
MSGAAYRPYSSILTWDANLTKFHETNEVRKRVLININVRARLQEEEACPYRSTAATRAAQLPVDCFHESSFSWPLGF